jgi:hypothetical protein
VNALHLESPSTSYRLRRTDYWTHLKEIFDEEEKTLKVLHFQDCACVWLEQGPIPPKGMMELQIELQTPTAMPNGMSNNASDVWETSPIATLQSMKTATLGELRVQILGDPVLGAVVGTRAFRLWNKGSKMLRGEEKTLKRLGVTSSCTLCIQVLQQDKEIPELTTTEGGGVVVLLRRRLVELRSFVAPVESVLITQKRGNQMFVRRSELVNHIIAVAGNIVESHPKILVAKLVTQSGRWKVLVDPFEEEAEALLAATAPPGESKNRNNNNNNNNNSNVKTKKERKSVDEVFVGDGDLLVWKLCSEDPNGMDDFVSLLNKQYGDAYVSTRNTGSSVEMGPRNKPREVGLQISDDGW